MREAKIICPVNNADQMAVCDNAIAMLVEAFGGCTNTIGFGHWRDAGQVISEPVAVLTVAASPNLAALHLVDHQMRQVVEYIGRELRQQCVYVTWPNGTVELIDTSHLWAEQAANEKHAAQIMAAE